MGLNDVQLSSTTIAQLYPYSLIAPDTVEELKFLKKEDAPVKNNHKTDPHFTDKWKSLGNNQQNILVVVNYSSVVHLPDEELSFLTTMLTACKLSLADVAIINKENYKKVNYKNILEHFKSRVVFLFGTDPLDFGLPVGFPYFQIQTVANCTFLYIPALEEREKDSLLKSKLWICLRTIFGI